MGETLLFAMAMGSLLLVDIVLGDNNVQPILNQFECDNNILAKHLKPNYKPIIIDHEDTFTEQDDTKVVEVKLVNTIFRGFGSGDSIARSTCYLYSGRYKITQVKISNENSGHYGRVIIYNQSSEELWWDIVEQKDVNPDVCKPSPKFKEYEASPECREFKFDFEITAFQPQDRQNKGEPFATCCPF